MDPLLASGASAGIGILSNIFGNIGRGRRERKAWERNVEFWHMQNEYNHPSAQMARLREAGLNPNLIYGTSPTSAVGQAESIHPAKAAPYEIENPLSQITRYSEVKHKEAVIDNLRAMNTVHRQEALLKGAQIIDKLTDAEKKGFDLGVARELKDTQVSVAKENLRQMEATTLNKQLDADFKSQTLKNRVADIFYRVENAKEELTGKKLINELRSLERDLKQIGIEKGDPWYFRIFGRGILNFMDQGAPPDYYNYKD